MTEFHPSRQFGTQDLFIAILVVAVVLAFLAKETTVVAVATIFCCISWIGLAVAIWISGSHLVRQLSLAFQHRQFRYFLGRRIKWTLIDISIVAWLLVAIAAANFVLENYVSGAKVLLFSGLASSPVIAALLLYRFNMSPN